MSRLLDDLIQQTRADADAYEEFLRKAEAVALYNNLPSIPATHFRHPTADEPARCACCAM
jgi:type I restriction enzyme R subunit